MHVDMMTTADEIEESKFVHQKHDPHLGIIRIVHAILAIILLTLILYFAWMIQKHETENAILIDQLNKNSGEYRFEQGVDCTSCQNTNSDKRSKRQLGDMLRGMKKAIVDCNLEECARCFQQAMLSNNSSVNQQIQKTACPICYSKDCTRTAAYYIDAMDTTVDPCQDFYQFTCGNFLRKHIVPEHEYQFTTIHLFYNNIGMQNKELLENIVKSSKAKVIEKMQDIYHVCMNVSETPEKEVEALKTYAVDILHWPLASGKKWQPELNNLNEILLNLEKIGYANHIFKFSFFEDHTEPSVKQINFPSIDLRTFYNASTTEEEYRKNAEESYQRNTAFLRKLVKKFGNVDEESINQDIDDMTRLSEMIAEEEDKEANIDSDYISIEQLYKETNDKIDWLPLFNQRMKLSENYFKKTGKAYMLDLRNLRVFAKVLETFSLRTIMNAAGWKALLADPIFHAGPTVDKLVAELAEAGGDMQDQPIMKGREALAKVPSHLRYYYCSQLLNMFYPMGMARLYVDKYIDKSKKKNADELIQSIAKSYKKMIQKSTWLDDATKKAAIKKADAIKRHVGYPDFIFDDAELDKEYAHMPDVKSTHFENILAFKRLAANLPDMTLPKRDDQWTDSNPTTINAHYLVWDNSIWFPAVTLQVPFFDNTRMAAVNYGLMGTVIGHEIGHAFDTQGRDYDEKGERSSWWTDSVYSIFENKSSCLANQFSNYCPEELEGNEHENCLNGYQTLGENIADSTGLQAGFEAYQTWIKEHGPEQRLPGLEKYSPEQLFFISYAYFYCDITPPGNYEAVYQMNEHAPGKYRVLGTLSNSQYFREAFQCSEGPMNRGKKSCTIW